MKKFVSEKFIPLSVPNLKGNELAYVTKAVDSEWVSTGGAYVDEFESAVARYVHAEGAVSCQNGTSGLHIGLLLTGVTPDDIVLVPTLTFIAAVNPIAYIGAEPIFMDCDESLCMDPKKLWQFCETECKLVQEDLIHKQTGKKIKTVVVVHVFGNMADMVSIMELAKKYHLKVLEDATEALGTYYTAGRYKGKYAGTIGDVGVYSFNGNKIITTGGGGMIVSDNTAYLKRGKHLTTQAKSDTLYYEHDEIGYNYRMTNLQAALGIAQLEQLEDFITIKRQNYERYQDRIGKISGLSLLPVREEIRSNHWFYALCCDDFVMGRDDMIAYLSECNIQTRPVWGLIHMQKPYRDCLAYNITEAEKYRDKIVNLPCSTNLMPEDVDAVMRAIEGVV